MENPEVDPPEVYDIASQAGEQHSPESAPPLERQSPSRSARKCLPSGMKLGRRRALFRDRDPNQGDVAWNLEDWGELDREKCLDERINQMTDRICLLEVDESLDKEQRVIADVVRSELRVDLESVVGRVVNKIHESLAAKVKDDVHNLSTICSLDALETSDQRYAIASLAMEVEHLRNAFQGHVDRKRWEEDIGSVASERSAITTNGCPMAVWPVTDQLKFGAIEVRLEKYRKNFESITAQSKKMIDILAKHDADIIAGTDALKEVEMKFMNACEKERLNAQNIWVRQARSMELCSSIEEKIATNELNLHECTDAAQCLKTQLSKNDSEQRVLQSALGGQCELTERLTMHSQELANAIRDLSAKLEFKVDMETLSERDERRDRQLRGVLEESESALHKREEEMTKVAKALEQRDLRMETFASALQMTRMDVADEIHRGRDLLHKWVDEACGEAKPGLAVLTKSVEQIQGSMKVHEQVQSQHTEWIQKISKSAISSFMCTGD